MRLQNKDDGKIYKAYKLNLLNGKKIIKEMRKAFQGETVVADDSSISIITQYHRYFYSIGDYIIIDRTFDIYPFTVNMRFWKVVK